MPDMTMSQLATNLAKAGAKLESDSETKLRQLSQIGVGLVKREIQGMHAVDTGTMLNSTTADKTSSDEYLIGPTVQYATYVALGTSRMTARPFHIEAAKKLSDQAQEMGFGSGLGV